MTAAIAAVMSYLQEEEAALQMQASAEAERQAKISVPSTVFNPWGLAGRQAHMQMRSMIQLKAFHHRLR